MIEHWVHKMRRYPPSTIYRYLDLPSIQIIQTHNTHRHNTTQPSQTLAQAAHPLPSNTTHTTATKTQTYIPLSPCFSRIGKTQTQSSTYDMTTDSTKPTDSHQLQESLLDTIHGRHIIRFRSDHHTHQYTHNFHKHHTDGRQAQHTKGQDA